MAADGLWWEKGKLVIRAKGRRPLAGYFWAGMLLLTLLSVSFLDIHWLRLVTRLGDLGTIFGRMLHFNFHDWDVVLLAFAETFSIMVLATLYSILSGLVLGLLAARNVDGCRPLAAAVLAFSALLRAVPTPVWVLLTLVCFGFGPEAGIVGLFVHTTAFFARAFAQAFEDVPGDVLEALAALGAGKLQIICCALLPSAATQLLAWLAMRFEVNFSECAILGMVGAGGIGFVISTSLQSYDYGTAGLAILLVFGFAFFMERGFMYVKQAVNK